MRPGVSQLVGVFLKLPQIAFMSCSRFGMFHLLSAAGSHKLLQAARRALLAGFFAAAWISLCACTQTYQPPANTIAPQPLPALTLIQAEQKGYTEGLAAGERIQAWRDRAAEAAKDKQPASQPAKSGATASPMVADPVPPKVAPQPPPAFSYSPAGPAIPVTPVTQTGCKKSDATVCD